MRPLVHDLAKLRGGAASTAKAAEEPRKQTVSPSLLSADWSDIASKVLKCEVR